ncbi:aromatic acid exporter family protein [Kitasatospora saccharophila]|uniref:FUSC family protein n=1 Tax=Kitasatospora saccharophila TaxID=407973 RepID=UPI0036255311
MQTARVAVACALAWEAAVILLGEDEQPVLAPLAALLTVQLTVFRTLAQGLRQTGGVVLGALAALGLLRLAGANFASIGLAVGVCLGLGKLLRLGEQATEVPVTVLLVLSTGAPYAPVRIWDTLVGVASGVLVNLVAAPPPTWATPRTGPRGSPTDSPTSPTTPPADCARTGTSGPPTAGCAGWRRPPANSTGPGRRPPRPRRASGSTPGGCARRPTRRSRSGRWAKG